ncbi:hypothetical protein KY330_05920 [Candidatus Woesearchaeota archaeon]|nr:hypothetical protein [Candidatus Woesearchaeota archaeon]
MRFNKDEFAYFMLTVFLSVFFGVAMYEKKSSLSLFLFLVLLLAFVQGLRIVYCKSRKKRYTMREHYNVVIGSVMGAVVTYYISVNLGYGPVIGAGVVGVLGALICKGIGCLSGLGAPVYMGAFVGMSSALVLPGFALVALAGLIAGILFVSTHDVYIGLGGKLGTMAFMGVCLALLIMKLVGIL